MISLTLKALLGALAVLLIALLARSKSFYIAGLVPLFPTFAVIAHYIIGTERPAADLRTTAVFGLWSLIPYAIYLLVVVWSAGRLPLPATLLLAMLAWGVAAMLLIMLWVRVYPT
ncbi:membrane protein GlpM [Halopseudomonas litoralis]|uniref:Membrane protein GlpM n=1 Tax=Halopseudomonas litoralis TaxID=797277 RepID=A0A1H1XPG6_9GAMM|nr:membrane protein GlpM [Halopseudomonas litoralis]